MYLARVSVGSHTPAELRRAVLGLVEEALRVELDIGQAEIFMMLHEHSPADFRINEQVTYANSSGLILIQISHTVETRDQGTLTGDLRNRIFSQITRRLWERGGISKADVFLTLLEIPEKNPSSGVATFSWVSVAPRQLFKLRDDVADV